MESEWTAGTSPPRPWWRRWVWPLTIVGFWTIPALLSAGQIYIALYAEGQRITFARAVAMQLPAWYFWAALTPLILWLGRRCRIDRRGRVRCVALHLAAALVLTLAHLLVMAGDAWYLAPYPVQEWGFSRLFTMLALRYLHLDLLTYAAILGVAYAIEFYRRLRERELQASKLQSRLVQAQLQALRMQLHPHFLFNTLNAVSSMVRKGEQRSAVRMLAGLSDLLRMALENEGAHKVALRQELEFLQTYLQLEQIRFRDRLRVRIDLAPETLDALVPNLALQPLVENAIRHGIARRADAGLIEITARRDGDSLHVQVRDDGPGPAIGPGPSGHGVGLTNTRARLAQLYGERWRLELRSADAGGALATLEVPFVVEEPEAPARGASIRDETVAATGLLPTTEPEPS